jgi:hypothetical protein
MYYCIFRNVKMYDDGATSARTGGITKKMHHLFFFSIKCLSQYMLHRSRHLLQKSTDWTVSLYKIFLLVKIQDY